MKKAIIILGLIILSTGCGKKEEKTIPEENKPKIDYKIDTIETVNCENEVKEYYTKDDQTVYLVCLDEITLLDYNQTLKEYLDNGNSLSETADKISDLLTIHASLIEDGTSVYRDTGQIIHTKNGLTLIKCNKSESPKDIYIGTNEFDEDWGFENGFCGYTLTQEEN